MRFRIKVVVVSCFDTIRKERLRGVALLREYIRLNFPEEHRPNKFGSFGLYIEIPDDIALQHPKHFEYTDTVTVIVDSYHTEPGDWDDWGSAGLVLKGIQLPINTLSNALNAPTSEALKINAPPARLNQLNVLSYDM